MLIRKSILYVLSTFLLLASSFVEAQQVKRVARIGYLDNNHVDALLLGTGGFFAFHQKRIIELSVTNRLPAMHTNARFC